MHDYFIVLFVTSLKLIDNKLQSQIKYSMKKHNLLTKQYEDKFICSVNPLFGWWFAVVCHGFIMYDIVWYGRVLYSIILYCIMFEYAIWVATV